MFHEGSSTLCYTRNVNFSMLLLALRIVLCVFPLHCNTCDYAVVKTVEYFATRQAVTVGISQR